MNTAAISGLTTAKGASAATRAMSSKISRLNDVRALERVEGVLDVTLAATNGIKDLINEMTSVAATLQDQSLSAEIRSSLIAEFDRFGARINELTEMASFGGRNLINPNASKISGDLALPDGQVVEARDLRLNEGRILSVGPLQESLKYTISFDGSTSAEMHNGAGPLPATTLGYPAAFGTGENGGQALNGHGDVAYFVSGMDEISVTMSLRRGINGISSAFDFRNVNDTISIYLHNTTLQVKNNGSVVGSTTVPLDDWYRFAMTIDGSGSASL